MSDYSTLWQWRRTVSDLYATLRAGPDGETHHAWFRDQRRELFARHPQSPIPQRERAEFRGPQYFPYDPALRFAVTLEKLDRQTPERMAAGSDGVLALIPFARSIGLRGRLGGELTFYWIDTYGGGVFVPFRDATNGRETYGAGRYLLDTAKGADLGSDAAGRAILDFNFSYFPSCAYSEEYVCPLAPEANRLAVPVHAGERLPVGAER